MKNNWKSQNKTQPLIGCRAPSAPPTDVIVLIPALPIGPRGGGRRRRGGSFISERIQADKGEKFELLKEEIHQSGGEAALSQTIDYIRPEMRQNLLTVGR